VTASHGRPAESLAKRWLLGGLIGLLSATSAIAVGEVAAALAAVFGANAPSAPVVAVGEWAIQLSPAWLKESAIRQFGTHDKTALLTGVYLGILAISVHPDVPGLEPFFTPNVAKGGFSGFYRVDTALSIPQVDPKNWMLRIHGMVDRPFEIDFDDLLRMPLEEHDLTLTCVSNPVGGPYCGNARWLGTQLAPLLRRAGVQSGADQILSTSTDGMTIGSPVEAVLDGRQVMLAVAMNGETLPIEHGFPCRMLIPGLYGYVSATKWVVDLELTTFAQSSAYWVTNGWSQQAPVKTASRIDVPQDGATVNQGTVTLAGVAWATHRAVDAVEVRIDSGPWIPAVLATSDTPDTWRMWSYAWQAERGSHMISVRCTDGTGTLQMSLVQGVIPNGASGYHSISVNVM
jgi:DMSO/TMAO reductase YedYZ molybdopterin-dependent catalytic subunit